MNNNTGLFLGADNTFEKESVSELKKLYSGVDSPPHFSLVIAGSTRTLMAFHYSDDNPYIHLEQVYCYLQMSIFFLTKN